MFESLVKDSGPAKIFDKFVLELFSCQQKYSYVKLFYGSLLMCSALIIPKIFGAGRIHPHLTTNGGKSTMDDVMDPEK